MKSLVVLGIRGVPAQHGGFETFAEYLCSYLIEKEWEVTVYCQEEGAGGIYETVWNNVKRIHIPVRGSGALSTIVFDLKSIVHSLRQNGVFLTLGYNTAVFNILHRAFRKTNVINMDGIEWKRQKWGFIAKTWFWLNERFGCWFGNHLIADHPEIKRHLVTRVSETKVTMIPYGAVEVDQADEGVLEEFELTINDYAIVIARPEPENSILEVVEGFSKCLRNRKLVLLGDFDFENNAYHKAVRDRASDEVIFLGAIYDQRKVFALRKFSAFYIHGHQVGGTNPSLVEALGAGNAVLAHNNKFNRWVTGSGAVYFSNSVEASEQITELFENSELCSKLQGNSIKQFENNFRWNSILQQYETLLLEHS